MRILLFFSLFFLYACAYSFTLFEPKNYDDCVLEGMKGVTANSAVRAVTNSCRSKFPSSSNDSNNVIKQCFFTLVGDKFIKGKPENIDDYVEVTFNGSSSRLFFVSTFDRKKLYSLVKSNELAIKQLCPDISLD